MFFKRPESGIKDVIKEQNHYSNGVSEVVDIERVYTVVKLNELSKNDGAKITTTVRGKWLLGTLPSHDAIEDAGMFLRFIETVNFFFRFRPKFFRDQLNTSVSFCDFNKVRFVVFMTERFKTPHTSGVIRFQTSF